MIEVKHLTRYYGNFLALNDVSFELQKGQVVALAGLNGAGKTTCLRILTGFLSPSSGSCAMDGVDVFANPMQVRSRIGYLPENPPLYQELTVEDFLHFVARMRGIPESEFEKEFLRVVELTQLQLASRAIIRNLSLGFRKRVGIAQALIGTPEFLIFDEPISGLDPHQIIEMRKLIKRLGTDHTILISSHILAEVAHTCNRVLILHNGRLVGDLGESEMPVLEQKFMELTKSPIESVGGV